jgi:hypothetical protein
MKQLIPHERSHLEVSFTRRKLLAFACRLMLVAIGRAGRGRRLDVQAEDGKLIAVIFRI